MVWVLSRWVPLSDVPLTQQNGLFTLYNAIVRASPESREGALDFFAKVVALNVKRAGSHVSYTCPRNN